MAYTSNAPAQNVASTATQNGGVAHNNNQATAFSPSHSTLSIQMAVPEPETFMGIPVQNPKKAKLVKIVYWLVMLAVLLETSQFILYVSDRTGTSTLLSAVINFMIALTVPYCGYKGAKDDDGTMLCWFCGCNFADACYTFLILLWLNNHIDDVQEICDECASQVEDFDYNEAEETYCPGGSIEPYCRAEDCLYGQSSNIRFKPEYCSDENFDKLIKLKDQLMTIEIPLAFANLLMFYYGNELYRSYEKVHLDLPMQLPPSETPVVMEAQTSFASMPQPAQESSNQPNDGNYIQLQPLNVVNAEQPPKENNDAMATFAMLPFAGEAAMPAYDNVSSFTTFATAATLPQPGARTEQQPPASYSAAPSYSAATSYSAVPGYSAAPSYPAPSSSGQA